MVAYEIGKDGLFGSDAETIKDTVEQLLISADKREALATVRNVRFWFDLIDLLPEEFNERLSAWRGIVEYKG